MEHSMSERQKFFGYPEAKETSSRILKTGKPHNPIFSGWILVVGAAIISKFHFLQHYLWRNAGFGVLRSIPELHKFTERYDPTVIPLANSLPDLEPCDSPDCFRAIKSEVTGRFYSAADYHSLYRTGVITPKDVAHYLLPLIRKDLESSGSHSTAFIDSRTELVMKTALASTQRYADGNPLGVLDGVPVAVKDETDVAGYPTTFGRKHDPQLFEVKSESAFPVKMWEDAGAMVLGKTNMHELGADTTNNNPNYGTPVNPYNGKYYTGGSSGGSAYSVAVGLVPIAMGNDGGGSIRLPASYCGVYGLKPSHGRVGETRSSVTVTGPIAATMADLEVAYRVMARPNPGHPVGCLFDAPRSLDGPRSRSLGLCEAWFEGADSNVKSACRQAIDWLVKECGYTILSIEIPYLAEGQKAHGMTILSTMASHLKSQFPGRYWLKDLNSANQVLMTVGSQTPAVVFLMAQQMRSLQMSHLAFLYQKYPGLLIITPTSPIAGYPIARDSDLAYGMSDANTTLRNMEYIYLANFTGCPAITCPVGYVCPSQGTRDVPIGLMAMSEWGSEDSLIEWGRDVESWLHTAYPAGRLRPACWEDVPENARKEI